MKKHTILFLAADPSGTDRLALDREARSIQIELDRSCHRDQLEFETRWATEPLDLLRELRKLKPTVVHYSGHGGQGGLLFQTSDRGRAHVVSTAAIAETFGAAGASVQLVVLNACYSESHADALLAHVDCVVGIAGAIPDDAARSFAIGFYGGLGERESVAAAYKQGCAAISLEAAGDREWCPCTARDANALDRAASAMNRPGPQLRVRHGVDANQLILGSGPTDATTVPRASIAPASRARSLSRRERTPLRRRSHAGYAAVIAGAGAMLGAACVLALLRRDPPSAIVDRAIVPGPHGTAPAAPPGMVRLPARELELGSTGDEIDGAFAWCRALTAPADCRRELYERERPVHRVRLSSLWFDVRERSTGELAVWLSSLLGVGEQDGWLVAGGVRLAEIGEDRDLRRRGAGIVPRPGTEQLPAVDVTYDGARGFCQARGLDLPTEAQWERAARGPERRRFPWGNVEPSCARAVYGRGQSGPCPRGERAPVDADTADRTPEGIANLGGNVAEWVVDRYVDGGHAPCPDPCVDPVLAATADPRELHVIRGGGFESLAEQLRGAGRGRAPRNAAFGNTGFRCAGPAGRDDR
jgi:formylglycine-generating enzyme required for sulfatase activity